MAHRWDKKLTKLTHLESQLVFVITSNGLITSVTGDVEQISDKHSLRQDLPQLCDGLGGSSLTLAV